jgi:hypothetical protein
MFYAIPDTLLKVSLNTNKTGHHVLRYYSVENGDQFYWCLTTFNNVSGIAYRLVTKLVTMFYAIPDTLLKVSLNTNKNGHHVLRYT